MKQNLPGRFFALSGQELVQKYLQSSLLRVLLAEEGISTVIRENIYIYILENA